MAQLDINGILDSIETILTAANTTTASPVDLSANCTNRVSKVMARINPDIIPPQASFFPFVTCFAERKTIELKGIVKNQASAKRMSELEILVACGMINANITDATDDPSLKDLYYLTENVEEILRSNDTLTNEVDWQMPTEVQYGNILISDEEHIRLGLIRYTAKIYY